MKPWRLYAFFFACMIFTTFNSARSLAATERVVVPALSQCPSGSICYTTIQSAINAADPTLGDAVSILPGTYTETVTLNKNIPIEGTETARVIISGNGSGPIITVSGVSSVSIRRLSFTNATTGISVVSSPTVTITNNIFRVGTAGTGVSVDSTSTVAIMNNTFYQNATAINRATDIPVKNNLFTANLLAISAPAAASTLITYNSFFVNTSDGPVGSNAITALDPLFVDVSSHDFHLKLSSPCIDSGDPSAQYDDSFNNTRNDIGAYGGPGSDTIPFQISGVAVLPTTLTSVSMSWSPNSCYVINGYHIYYGTASGVYNGTGAAEGNSPVLITPGTTTTTPLTNLAPAPAPPPVPTLISTSPLNQSLVLTWTASSGATGYNVYYGTVSPPTNIIHVGNTTSYTLTGLTNGQTYFVAVSAFIQTTYFMTVTAIDSSAGPFAPGISHESTYSQEVSANIGNPNESALSNILSDFPEPIIANPNLPNNGCFIATAAYGHYSSPQVRVLREFRDRYLLTNAPGRFFVRWYYKYSPIAADYLNEHPWLKPVVRTVLLPVVGGAWLVTETSPLQKTLLIIVVILFLIYVVLKSAGFKQENQR
jgi:hypothetical protein